MALKSSTIKVLDIYEPKEDIYISLETHIRDIGNIALNKGIDTVAIVGDGITENIDPEDPNSTRCLLMQRDLDTSYEYTNFDYSFWPNRYVERDGLTISEIYDLEYIYFGANANDNVIIDVWIVLISGKPIMREELTSNHFPVITTDLDHDISSLSDSIPGFFELTWQNPPGMFTNWIDMYWMNYNFDNEYVNVHNPMWDNFSYDPFLWTSYTFDTNSTLITADTYASINIFTRDIFAREYSCHWRWHKIMDRQTINDGTMIITDESSGDWINIKPIVIDRINEFQDDKIDIEKFYTVKDSSYLYWRMDFQGDSLNINYHYALQFVYGGWPSSIGDINSQIIYDENSGQWEPYLFQMVSDDLWESLDIPLSSYIQDGIIAMKVPLNIFYQTSYLVVGANWTFDKNGNYDPNADQDSTSDVLVIFE